MPRWASPVLVGPRALNDGLVLLAQQKRLKRTGHRIDVERDQEPIKHIGAVRRFDVGVKGVDPSERPPA